MAIDVFRGGVTASTLRKTGYDATIKPHAPEKAIEINFKIAASRGETRVLVRISQDTFKSVARAMMDASPRLATKAFGAALQARVD